MQSAPPPLISPTKRLRDRALPAACAQPTLAEIFPHTAVDAGAVGFALAHLIPGTGVNTRIGTGIGTGPRMGTRTGSNMQPKTGPKMGPVLWLQDRQSRQETGRPCLAGLGFGGQIDLLYLELNRPADVLWAMEEGLRCPSLGGVVAEVWGNPAVLDFTATKRLALRSEAQAVPAWLIRRAATADLSAARERWRVASLPSAPVPHDMRAPGAPLWRAELFRARWRTPGQWVARYDKGVLVLEHGMERTDDAVPVGMRA